MAGKCIHGNLYNYQPAHFRVLPDPETKHGHGIGKGVGGHVTGTGRRLGGRQDVRVQGDRRVDGAWGDHKNTLLLVGRVLVQVMLYR